MWMPIVSVYLTIPYVMVTLEPNFYIFDKATRSLGHKSERMVQESIETLSPTKIILVITHRISTQEKTDFFHTGRWGRAAVVCFESLQESEKENRIKKATRRSRGCCPLVILAPIWYQ